MMYVVIALVIAAAAYAITLSVGQDEPLFAIAAEKPAWFVALKFQPGRSRAVIELPAGISQKWTVNADFTMIGEGERYWDRFMILAGNLYETRLPIVLGDEFADAYVVRLSLVQPPPLLLGLFRLLHLTGMWSMPRGEVSTDTDGMSTRPDAMPTKDTIKALLSRPPTYQPAMVNFLRFKEEATYDVAQPGAKIVSGRKAYSRYGMVAFQSVYRTGGRLAFFGRTEEVLQEPKGGLTAGRWDEIGVMEYPEPKALLSMEQFPRYRAALRHRDAGLEKTVIVASSHDRLRT
jgi:uncharacterized protein (DUF1330 family)